MHFPTVFSISISKKQQESMRYHVIAPWLHQDHLAGNPEGIQIDANPTSKCTQLEDLVVHDLNCGFGLNSMPVCKHLFICCAIIAVC